MRMSSVRFMRLFSSRLQMILLTVLLTIVTGIMPSSVSGASDAKPFLGDWDLTLPGGAAGWLSVTEKDGQLQASILWGGGSVVPIDNVKVEGDGLLLTRVLNPQPKHVPGKNRPKQVTHAITVRATGDAIALDVVQTVEGNKKDVKLAAAGKRSPPMPAVPGLSNVKFGAPIVLFDGKDLSGWRLVNPEHVNGWSVEDGILINRPVQEAGKPHKRFGNLRTDREYEDCNLTLDVRVPKGGNSGVYLRGIYEVQVFDSHGKPLDSHNMGAIYSRICPAVAAEKPAGQWQTLDITLVDRHVTVILNSTTIIDNQPLPGCTGGALWSDQLRPGPIYLQGDHSGVEYRNIVLRPVVK